MKKYEFKILNLVIIVPGTVEFWFNDLGEQGFQLIQVSRGYAYFQKEISDGRD